MRKFTHGATRLGTAAVAAAVLMTAACDDATAPWPSRGPAADMEIYTIPAGQPFLVLRGENLRLLGVATDASGTWIDSPVTWSSSNEAIASISADGLLTGVGNVNPSNVDTITVTATSAGMTTSKQVVVRRFPAVASIGMSAVSMFLEPGQTVQITATARDLAGIAIPGRELVWASSNTNVATVTQTGLVTIVGAGTANITASADEDGTIITGTRAVASPEFLQSGVQVGVQNVPDGGSANFFVNVPAGASSLVVQISGGVGGDADLYVYPPTANPTAPEQAGWTCRPYLIGSTETCTINDPAAGNWRIVIHAYPGDGTIQSINLRATVN
jgi:hypothetical protein